jgi:hypothetical protein
VYPIFGQAKVRKTGIEKAFNLELGTRTNFKQGSAKLKRSLLALFFIQSRRHETTNHKEGFHCEVDTNFFSYFTTIRLRPENGVSR